MLLKLTEPFRVEDLRRHSAEEVRRLRELLSRGARARRDPGRDNFYEIEDGPRVFYIHTSPGRLVLLLAIWVNDGAPIEVRPDAHLSQCVAV